MPLQEFFDWWRTQLGELIPASWRGRGQHRRNRLTLTLGTGKVTVADAGGRELGQFDLAPQQLPTVPDSVTSAIRNMRGTLRQVDVVVPHREYLLRTLTLPAAARANLHEAIGYQLGKLTPFNSSQLLYACGTTGEAVADGMVGAWLAAVPRQSLQRAMAVIGQEIPAGPLPLAAPPPAEGDLRFTWHTAPQGRYARSGVRVAFVGMLLLWAAALGLHLRNIEQARDQLTEELDALRLQAAEVQRLRDRVSQHTVSAEKLTRLRQRYVSPLVVLDTLTEQLDDRTWLQNLELDGDELTLRGTSSAAATLIETLEASDLLHHVEFTAAITRNAGEDGDRFNLTARLSSTPAEGDG
ncbi:MAG: PilN domain-containing protein [Gammaproteobacteria bacterium]|nr:PilN domain-containing protein [Gammaproteobacteria bacterium]